MICEINTIKVKIKKNVCFEEIDLNLFVSTSYNTKGSDGKIVIQISNANKH